MLDRLNFPQPCLSLILFAVWQVLGDGISGASAVMGLILAWLIPQLTQGFWPERSPLRKPWKMAGYLLLVTRDIVTASITVTRLVLTPGRPRPVFISYPLTLQNPLAISMLASTISLTPGTVSADISDDNKLLLIHSLDAEDEQEVIDTIRNRYESRLLEMFQ